MKLLIEKLIDTAITRLQNKGKLPKDLNIRLLVERTRDEKHGHFACNVALMLAKQVGMPPRDLAELIAEQIPSSEHIAKITIAGPGFLNFFLTESALHGIVEEALQKGNDFGLSDKHKDKRIYIEFVGANPTGPLHVGHGRSAAYGACVSNLLEAIGYTVHREYYVNDAGRQMRILALSTWLRYLELLGEPITLPSNAYQGEYIIEIAKSLLEKHGDQFKQTVADIESTLPQDIDPEEKETFIDTVTATMQNLIGESAFEIFQQTALESILSDIKNDLEEFGVVYDEWFRESRLMKGDSLKKGINLLRTQGHTFVKDGALWFRATDFGDEKDRVLLRSNDQPTYFASDVAYHLYKYEQGYDHLIDIFGADHHGYIQRIRAFLKAVGKDPSKLSVLLVQFAILYRGKEKMAMSTRAGEFVTLRKLREEVGNDAARYFYIMRKPEQHLDFDLELAKSQSNDNPVYYIQYAHARICSVWKQLQTSKLTWNQANGLKNLTLLSQDIEKKLMNALTQFPEIIFNAATHHEPHTVANFLQSFANLFHSYYNACRFIIDTPDLRDARLCLIAAIQQVVKNGLHLLGLSAPESM